MSYSPRSEWQSATAIVALALLVALLPPCTPAAAANPNRMARSTLTAQQTTSVVAAELKALAEDVTTAPAFRYGARDNLGNTLDTLKIIENPDGGYLGVYHTLVDGVFYLKLATSLDLLNWTFSTDLDAHAHQPTIARLADGSFVVAYEIDSGGATPCSGMGRSGGNCIKFQYYPNLASLRAGSATRSFQAPRTLSNCAEGTPNIYAVTLNPDIDHSIIDIGHHYYRNCHVDRQARGTLTNFTAWTTYEDANLNTRFEALSNSPIGGNVGDRDDLRFKGQAFNLVEAQSVKGAWGTWRSYLYDGASNELDVLNVKTHNGSTALANPTGTPLTLPNGRPGIVFTFFIFAKGAAAGERGELIFYKELPTTVTFTAEADAYVSRASPAQNFGTDSKLFADQSPQLRSYLRFVVTGVSGPVQTAKLRLLVTDGTRDGPAVYATSSTWSETGITWSNKPMLTGAASDDKGAISTKTWVEFDVTPLVRGNGTYSFVLVPTSRDGLDVFSREDATVINQPQLIVTVSTT